MMMTPETADWPFRGRRRERCCRGFVGLGFAGDRKSRILSAD
jgi:hypothetical protein